MTERERAIRRYQNALHAIQTGVKHLHAHDSWLAGTDPVDLKVAATARIIDHAALVRLLIEKGVITEKEYLDACADGMLEEKLDFERKMPEGLRLI